AIRATTRDGVPVVRPAHVRTVSYPSGPSAHGPSALGLGATSARKDLRRVSTRPTPRRRPPVPPALLLGSIPPGRTRAIHRDRGGSDRRRSCTPGKSRGPRAAGAGRAPPGRRGRRDVRGRGNSLAHLRGGRRGAGSPSHPRIRRRATDRITVPQIESPG